MTFDSDNLFTTLGKMGIKSSIDLFHELKCVSALEQNLTLRESRFMDIFALDEDKIRSHILDCLVALRKVQKEKQSWTYFFRKMVAAKKIKDINYQLESAKNRIFASAVKVIIDDKEPAEGDQNILTSLITAFPDNNKMIDGRGWLPLHFAVALGHEISEEDVRTVYSADPMAMRRYNLTK
jgi:hypothetical protein